VVSAELKSVDPASLDAFRAELIDAGFEPTGEGSRRWQGPLHSALAELTSAKKMRICIQDGWPYRPPTLHVRGIASEHAVLNGEVCLFQPDEHDVSAWITLEAYNARIAEWAELASAGFRLEDDLLDPHLYFRAKSSALATLELAAIVAEGGEEKTGRWRGVWTDSGLVLALSPGSALGDALPGRWYYNPALSAPPRDLDGFRAALTEGQRKNLGRRLKAVQRDQREAVLGLLWQTRAAQRNCLVVLAEPEDGEPKLRSLELAPTDRQTLLLRAGPDTDELARKRVVLFGAGAIGSHVASLLARAGLGKLRVVEDDTLRPGNVVRHAGAPGFVGWRKAIATEAAVRSAAPWTKFEAERKSWDAERLAELISDCDLAIDATGLVTFAELLGRVALDAETSLISAALFRGGFLGRVRRQVPGIDTPFLERQAGEEFPVIPPGQEPKRFEAGCSAAVNNASPIAVAAISATTAEVGVDLLTERFEYPAELIDVYRPLDDPPFERIGRVIG
jgi:molybdopterin/thiamine biosynthesis adenylyltransferase